VCCRRRRVRVNRTSKLAVPLSADRSLPCTTRPRRASPLPQPPPTPLRDQPDHRIRHVAVEAVERLRVTVAKASVALASLGSVKRCSSVSCTAPCWVQQRSMIIQLGQYLAKRSQLVTDLADQVRGHAGQDGLQPVWAPLGSRPNPAIIAEVAVRRAANGVHPSDRRPTGAAQPQTASAVWQHHLDRSLARCSADIGRLDISQRPPAPTTRGPPELATPRRPIGAPPNRGRGGTKYVRSRR
jgi:hypothetical protein